MTDKLKPEQEPLGKNESQDAPVSTGENKPYTATDPQCLPLSFCLLKGKKH